MIIDQTQVPGRATILAYFFLLSVFVALVATEVMGLLPSSEVERGVGIVLALMLAATGNFLPKLLHPDRAIAGTLRRQRRSGWGLVLTGITLIVALIVAPTDQIELWSGVVGLGGLSLILVDALSHRAPGTGRERVSAAQSKVEKKHAATRLSAFLIVHAIGWVFAMFLADYFWGHVTIVWMAIAFAISNGLVHAIYTSTARSLRLRKV